MDKHDVFNWLAFFFSALTYVFYVTSILRKTETTTLSTWVAWLFMDCAVLAAMVNEHKLSYQLVAYAIGCVAVLIAGWRVGAASGWKPVDTACTAMVIIAAGLWGLTSDPSLAVIVELSAMGIGSVSLFSHIWESEVPVSPWPWLCNLVGAGFALPAATHWDIVGVGPPVVFLVLSVIFNAAMLRTHRNSKFLAKILLLDI